MHLKRSAASALLVIVAIGLGILLAGLLASRLVHRDASLQAIASLPSTRSAPSTVAAPPGSPAAPTTHRPEASTPPLPSDEPAFAPRTASGLTPVPTHEAASPSRIASARHSTAMTPTPVTEPLPVVAQPSIVEPAPSASVDGLPSTAPPAAPAPRRESVSTAVEPTSTPTPTPTPPRTRTVWTCPDGALLDGTSCITTQPYTFHEESMPYTFHEASMPYTSHRETRHGPPCSYLPNPVNPGIIDVFCTPHFFDVRDATPEGWSDNGSAWVRQVRDDTPAGWTDTGSRWTRQVRDATPEGFSDDGTRWRRVAPASSHEVPA